MENDGFSWKGFFGGMRAGLQGASRFTADGALAGWEALEGPRIHIGNCTGLTEHALTTRLGFILKANVGREAGNWRLISAQRHGDRKRYYQIVKINPDMADAWEGE